MKNNRKIFIRIVVLAIIAVLVIIIYHPNKVSIQNQERVSNNDAVATTGVTNTGQNNQESISTASFSADDFYALSSADRDNFLFMANEKKDYHVVVNATNDGIKNHRDLVWDDIDFWNHRGMALYSLGDCANAGAAFYHVLMRSPNDEMASGFITSILNDKTCVATTSTN